MSFSFPFVVVAVINIQWFLWASADQKMIFKELDYMYSHILKTLRFSLKEILSVFLHVCIQWKEMICSKLYFHWGTKGQRKGWEDWRSDTHSKDSCYGALEKHLSISTQNVIKLNFSKGWLCKIVRELKLHWDKPEAVCCLSSPPYVVNEGKGWAEQLK